MLDVVQYPRSVRPAMPDAVDVIRHFNRDWTAVLGLLGRGLLDTEHTLVEARVLYEIGQRPRTARADLRVVLAIDESFLTRVLRRLERAGLIATVRDPDDGRRLNLVLTADGRRAFAELDARSAAQIGELLASLTADQRRSTAASLAVVRRLLGPGDDAAEVVIREPGPGDLGWMVQRHGEVYADEYGWDASFEGLVARIVADFQADPDPTGRRGWIAEVDGARAGCVLCCRKDERTAQLRILLVEPWARGHGIGRRLVEECIAFARAAGYARLALWTNDVLTSARRIYEAAGFRLVDEGPHHSFGHDLVEQSWVLDLDGATG